MCQVDFSGIIAVLIWKAGDVAGAPVWESRRLPSPCYPDIAARLRPAGRIMIEVVNPDDPATVEKLELIVTAARSAWLRRLL